MGRGLKYIFKRLIGFPMPVLILEAVAAVWVAILPFAMHVEFGHEEYMMPKLFLFICCSFITSLGVTCGCRDLVMNKLVRSMPIAKELYTRSVPAFILILSIGSAAVLMSVYFLFLEFKGARQAEFSDTLIAGATVFFPMLLFTPLGVRVAGGGLIGLFSCFAPIITVMILCGRETRMYGFDLPIRIAAWIFGGVIVVGAVWVFTVSEIIYRESNPETTKRSSLP